ncbi:hypothetical protein C5C94_08120 [Rathayibacter sp. AY1C3]|nr:hypothetical protein C5B92_13680 [Rathayibacter sp. AY1A4]PPG79934.1 hypothetical protein C5C52_11530 [Rathayibacter sp. AY1E5]PPH31682.1 hypothetical protein C5C94_08120 [Rathayibacter sp. AY1C3]PPH65487.1 hypothetical protein C5D25_04255 [Rathayibacter sp. AY1D7]PPI29380.1 hypothetical protein C5D66_11525 [Rathayibacter sp. AY1B4]
MSALAEHCGHRSRRTRRLAVIVGAAVTVALLTGCVSSGRVETGALVAAPAGLEHVHGLGWDPVTGLTYAAAHSGVWVIPTDTLPDTYPASPTPTDDEAGGGPVAGRAQDTMGFTITPEGVFYASGHPDPADRSAPGPNLGLIRSIDAAATWEPVSLSGETDFHDLATVALTDAATRVYGYDASRGVILRSDDSGAAWTPSAQLPLRDLTVDPERPDRVFATTETGLQVSEVAAVTFRPVSGAPALFLVDGSAGGQLVGVDVDGTLWTGTLEGSWQSHGTLEGQPEAFALVDGEEQWVLAADERGVVASGDYGRTWTVLRPSS